HICQSAFCIGTGLPFEQTRPGIVRRFAASARAIPAFSTAVHPPYELESGSGDVDGSSAGLIVAGSVPCAAKITFDAGNRMPRITWISVPCTCASGAGGGAGGALHAATTIMTIAIDATRTNGRDMPRTLIDAPSDDVRWKTKSY